MADMEKMQRQLDKVQAEYDKGLLHPGELALEKFAIHNNHGHSYNYSDEEKSHIDDLNASILASHYMRQAAERMYGGGLSTPEGRAFLERNFFDRRQNTGSGNKETFFTDQKAPQ